MLSGSDRWFSWRSESHEVHRTSFYCLQEIITISVCNPEESDMRPDIRLCATKEMPSRDLLAFVSDKYDTGVS